jgi:F420-0:gamma-glutamyl ligase
MGEGNWGIPVVVIRGLDLYSGNDGVDAVYRLDDIDIIKKALKSF